MSAEGGNRCGYAAIVGRPNVGKSTLLNRLVGQKLAITSHKAQTTRHSILGIRTLPGGQIVYVDTPGIHQRADHAMNRYLNRTARNVLRDVDLLLFLVEAGRWTPEDEGVLNNVRQIGVPVILVVNKVDLIKDRPSLLPYLAKLSERMDFHALVPISARRGSQVEQLQQLVLQTLPKGENFFPEDQITDRPERFFAAELLREQLTRRYAKELPYALSVEIETFEEEGPLYRIGAAIWVERSGQKRILIGHQGQAMKETSTQARLAMEEFFQRRVFLSVWVRVKKSWSNDESALSRLGYGE